MAVQYCNYDIKGTLAVTGTSTFTGAATFGSSINMSDNQPINFGGQTMFTHTGSITRIGDNSSSSVLSIGSGDATFTGDIKQSTKIVLQDNGTIQWGGTADYGNLSWDTGYALIYGQSGKGIKLGTNGSTLALELDTSQNATFAGDIIVPNGDITTIGGNNLTISGTVTDHAGISFATNSILPCVTGALTNNVVDLGQNGNVYKNLYLGSEIISGGGATFSDQLTINTISNATSDTDKFLVSDSGVIKYRTGAQVLSDIGAASSGSLGNYLPLSGGTLTGPVGFGANAAGQDVYFYGNATGELMFWDASESRLTINHDTNDSGLDVFTVSSAAMSYPQLRVGRNTAEFWGVYTDDRNAYLVHRQDETTGTMSTKFDQWDSNTSDTLGFWAWRSGNASGGSMSTALELKQSGDAIFTGDVKANTHFTSSDTNVTLSTDSNGTVFLRPNGKSSTTAQSTFTTALASIGTGATFAGNIAMNDNDIDGIDELKFSSGTKLGDDGGTSYVSLTYADSGDGGIKIQDNQGQIQGYLYGDGGATSSFGLLDGTGSWAVRCLENEYVELRYDNSAKLRTISDGVYVAGKLGIGTSTPDTDGYSYFEDLVIKAGASSSDGAGITIDSGSRQYGGFAFRDSTGFQGEIFYDHTNESMNFKVGGQNNFTIGTSSTTVVGDLTVSGGDIILGGSGRIQGIDTVTSGTDAANKTYVDTQIATIPSGLNFQGNWNASTNSPTLASGTGTPGFYYNVSVAGSTNLDGETDWQVGDWAVFVEAGATDKWEKIDNTSALTGTGIAGRVAYWDSTNNLTQDSDLTFNGSSLVVGGTVTAQTGNSVQWAEAYNNQITAISDSGSSTITLTLTQEDGGTLTTSFSNPQGTVTKSGTPVNNQLAVWTSATNIEGEPELTYDGSTFTVGGSGNTTTYLNVVGTNTAGAPARAAAIRIYGYEGRGEGIFYYDTAYANDEWYSGIPYSGGSTYQIGFDTSGGQAEYVANSVLRITSSGQVQFNKYGTTSPFTGTVTNFPAFTGDGQIIERTPAQVLSDIGAAPATGGAYLPLAGGTMTGDIQFNEHSAKFNESGVRSWDVSASSGNLNITSGDSGGLVFLSPGISVEDNAFIGGYATITGNLTVNGATATFNPDADSSLSILNAGTDAVAVFAGTGDVLYLGGNNTTGMYLDQSANAVFSGNLYIPSYIYHSGDPGSDTYFGFNGNDNFSVVTAGGYGLVIDSNRDVTFTGGLTIPDYINHTGDSGTKFGFSANDTFVVRTGGAVRLTVNADGSSTFSDTVTADGGFLVPYASGTKKPMINLVSATNYGLWHTEASNDIFSFDFAGVSKHQFIENGNASHAGDLTVTGGGISLGGTGRIQGIDTVSAGTDAANKDYVDTAVAGSGSGTVTSVSSATTSQLTVSQSSPAPALSIVTAAVANGGTGLATGNQIYDWGVAAFAPIVSGGYLPLSGGTMTGDLRLNDNIQLFLGSQTDFVLAHNGSNSYISNYTGDLYIEQAKDDGDIIFKSDNGSGGTATYFRLDGGSVTNQFLKTVKLYDNVPLWIGDDNDLQIFHDGSNSYIQEAGTGELIISSGTVLRLRSDASPTGEEYINCTRDGAVALFYNNVEKFHTSASGVDVLGDLTVDTTAVIDGATTINGQLNQNGDIKLGASASIVLDDTPTGQTTSGSGTIVEWSVSVSTTAGNLYVIKSDGGWTTADADSEAKSTAMAAIALGSNATSGMLLQGFFYKSSHGFAIGSPLYISNTAGAFSNTRPTGTGDYVRIIGYATSTNYIYFDPDKTWVKID